MPPRRNRRQAQHLTGENDYWHFRWGPWPDLPPGSAVALVLRWTLLSSTGSSKSKVLKTQANITQFAHMMAMKHRRQCSLQDRELYGCSIDQRRRGTLGKWPKSETAFGEINWQPLNRIRSRTFLCPVTFGSFHRWATGVSMNHIRVSVARSLLSCLRTELCADICISGFH